MADLLGIDPQLQNGTAPTRSLDERPVDSPEQVRALAAEFESLLLGQMLQVMRASLLGDDDGKSSGFGGNPLADAMFSELSLALSRAGGIGVADSMMGALAREGGLEESAVPGVPLGVAPDGRLSAYSGLSVADAFGGPVTSEFGWRQHPIDGIERFHAGTDIALPTGQPVPSAREGRVTFAGEMAGYGKTVVIEHEGGLSTRYAHLSEISVQEGDQVAAGQTIAHSGATGRVTGPHLHFEVLMGAKPLNPEEFLNQSPSWQQP